MNEYNKKEMLLVDSGLLRHQAEMLFRCLKIDDQYGANIWLGMMEDTVNLLKIRVNESEGAA